jgi:hypothetical protein
MSVENPCRLAVIRAAPHQTTISDGQAGSKTSVSHPQQAKRLTPLALPNRQDHDALPIRASPYRNDRPQGRGCANPDVHRMNPSTLETEANL